jgi:hypothetical protein
MSNTGARQLIGPGEPPFSEINETPTPASAGRSPAEAWAPVFVDTSGRRERIWRRIAIVLAAAAMAYVMAIGASVLIAPVEPRPPAVELDSDQAEVPGPPDAPPTVRGRSD